MIRQFALSFVVIIFSGSLNAGVLSACLSALKVKVDKAGLFGDMDSRRDILEALVENENSSPEYKIQFQQDHKEQIIAELINETYLAKLSLVGYFLRPVVHTRTFTSEDIRLMRKIKATAVETGLIDVQLVGSNSLDMEKAKGLWSKQLLYKWFDDVFIEGRSLEDVETQIRELAALGSKNAYGIDRLIFEINKTNVQSQQSSDPSRIHPDTYIQVMNWAKEEPNKEMLNLKIMTLLKMLGATESLPPSPAVTSLPDDENIHLLFPPEQKRSLQ